VCQICRKLIGSGIDAYPPVAQADFVPGVVVEGVPLAGDACVAVPYRPARVVKASGKSRFSIFFLTFASISPLSPADSSALNFGSF